MPNLDRPHITTDRLNRYWIEGPGESLFLDGPFHAYEAAEVALGGHFAVFPRRRDRWMVEAITERSLELLPKPIEVTDRRAAEMIRRALCERLAQG